MTGNSDSNRALVLLNIFVECFLLRLSKLPVTVHTLFPSDLYLFTHNLPWVYICSQLISLWFLFLQTLFTLVYICSHFIYLGFISVHTFVTLGLCFFTLYFPTVYVCSHFISLWFLFVYTLFTLGLHLCRFICFYLCAC